MVYVDWNSDVESAVYNHRNFKTRTHIIQVRLGVDWDTAKTMLLEKVWLRLPNDKRSNTISCLTDATNPDYKRYDWLITYSALDVIKSETSRSRFNDTHSYQLMGKNDMETALALQRRMNDDELETISEMAVKLIFVRQSSRDFVETVLRHGSKYTMTKLNLTTKQFRDRLNSKIRYCKIHRGRIDDYFSSYEDSSKLYLINYLNRIISAIESTASDETIYTTIVGILHDNDWANQLLDYATETLGLRYQEHVMNRFGHNGRDDYCLINAVYAYRAQLIKELRL